MALTYRITVGWGGDRTLRPQADLIKARAPNVRVNLEGPDDDGDCEIALTIDGVSAVGPFEALCEAFDHLAATGIKAPGGVTVRTTVDGHSD